MKISIIVPIYNSEKYLSKCIESLLHQKYNNIEIILINDGSKDNSEKICKSYCDDRIKYFYKENGGVSSARNLGIKNATGDYVMFLDSDDWLELNTIENCINIITKYKVDIVKFLYKKDLKILSKKYKFSVLCNEVIKRKDYKKLLYKYIFTTYDFTNVTFCLIKKDLIKNETFNINLKYAEDFLFFMNIFNKSNNIYFLTDYFYHYRICNDSAFHSITREKSERIVYDNIFALSKIYELLNSSDLYNDYLNYLKKLINHHILLFSDSKNLLYINEFISKQEIRKIGKFNIPSKLNLVKYKIKFIIKNFIIKFIGY